MILDWETFLTFVPLLVQGAVTTIELTVLVTIFGFLIALPVALARNSASRAASCAGSRPWAGATSAIKGATMGTVGDSTASKPCRAASTLAIQRPLACIRSMYS